MLLLLQHVRFPSLYPAGLLEDEECINFSDILFKFLWIASVGTIYYLVSVESTT